LEENNYILADLMKAFMSHKRDHSFLNWFRRFWILNLKS
jgi:hypothetical protein